MKRVREKLARKLITDGLLGEGGYYNIFIV